MTFTHDEVAEIMSQLDTLCWQCTGEGHISGEPCDVCYGTGYQCTQAGIALLAFLKRQQKRIETTR